MNRYSKPGSRHKHACICVKCKKFRHQVDDFQDSRQSKFNPPGFKHIINHFFLTIITYSYMIFISRAGTKDTLFHLHYSRSGDDNNIIVFTFI